MREESLSVRRKIYRKICALGERFLPDKLYLEMLYQVRMGEKLDLKRRKTGRELSYSITGGMGQR